MHASREADDSPHHLRDFKAAKGDASGQQKFQGVSTSIDMIPTRFPIAPVLLRVARDGRG